MRLVCCLLLCGCAATIPDDPEIPRLRIAFPKADSNWRSSFCGMCCAIPRGEGTRVFATGRTANGSVIGWMDFDADWNRVGESPGAGLVPGQPGTHDCESVLMPCVVNCDDHLRMYYGAHGGGRFPGPSTCIGLAFSDDGGATWRKHPMPILSRDDTDPDGSSTPFVVRVAADDWRMFYTSIRRYPNDTFRGQSRFAISRDGISWSKPANNVAMDRDGKSTCSRPCVWKDRELWRMVYSFAQAKTETAEGKHYHARMATSIDGLHFIDAVELLAPSESGFDSQMVAYAFPIPERGIFLYSGNGFGAGGIGLAKLNLP